MLGGVLRAKGDRCWLESWGRRNIGFKEAFLEEKDLSWALGLPRIGLEAPPLCLSSLIVPLLARGHHLTCSGLLTCSHLFKVRQKPYEVVIMSVLKTWGARLRELKSLGQGH